MTPEDARFAATALRATDRDRYFSTLILPAPRRDAVTALYAFSADVASVRERAREPAAGEIRLQWWADALTGAGRGEVRQNPLAAALLDVVAEYGLPVPALSRLIAARRFDLYDDPMPDVTSFEGYAGETSSVLYQLAAMLLAGGQPVEAADAAGHLGVAQALVGHLRAFGYNASRGRIVLPWSVFAANGVSEGEVLAGQVGAGISASLRQLAEMAEAHLAQAAAAIRLLPRPLRPAFAPLAVLRLQLRRLRPDAPFEMPPDLADWRKIAALARWRG
jgi:phytoene synthase